jgi:hypothetical protein
LHGGKFQQHCFGAVQATAVYQMNYRESWHFLTSQYCRYFLGCGRIAASFTLVRLAGMPHFVQLKKWSQSLYSSFRTTPIVPEVAEAIKQRCLIVAA